VLPFLPAATELRWSDSVTVVQVQSTLDRQVILLCLEVTPHSRLSWSNDESPDGAITTVTFEESGGKTQVVVHDLYLSKEALDAAIASESTQGFTEQFEQLDEVLVTQGASAGRMELES
jgi:uncharacterized protein YndB with AHSA1/START domain